MAKINHFGLKLSSKEYSFNLVRDEYPHTDKFLEWTDFFGIIWNGVREEIEKEDAYFSQLFEEEEYRMINDFPREFLLNRDYDNVAKIMRGEL